MIHLRIVAPEDVAHRALEVLNGSPAVLNIVHLHGAAQKPDGDLILCDVAREEASVILGDLKELEIPRVGSIAVEHIETALSDAADAAERAAPGLPSDAVVWEEVEQRTSENTELSISFVTFMVLAMQIGAVGILLDQPILIVGAMVVGPEFGPLAGLSVALVERRQDLARRSLAALGVGFPAGIALACVATLVFKWIGASPDNFVPSDHELTRFISEPGFFSFFVAFVAGTAGILSLTNAKSGALIGVLISVTTIPAASNIGVAAAYADWNEAGGAAAQLAINLTSIVLAGLLTLFIQRRYYIARRRKHLDDPRRASAGLPVGRSRRPRRGS
ncbi:MAG: hypothetical protein QOI32_2514 [Thermoleophilaceae bacterium]|jgi:uncharacterized hydrophobic protein (TIGR00271 family)|nr:hypothetical protein [Thermoleophilaceae bacterium]